MVETSQHSRIELRGAPGSPYTRKMLAWLRFKHIPYAIMWGRSEARRGYPSPKVSLIPTLYLEDESGDLEAVVDSTPIIKRLDSEYPARSTTPNHPVLSFYSDLIEDYGDEWLTKIMFHYRWAFSKDAENASSLLSHFGNVQIDAATAANRSEFIADRQIGRLYVVGSNEVTAPLIEASYLRVIDILDSLIQSEGFVLGARPSAADFAIFGQFTQIAFFEPTSGEILAQRSQRFRAWLYQVEDLSGLAVSDDDWLHVDKIPQQLHDLLTEIGRTYVPVMLANSEAINNSKTDFETEIDGQKWVQPTFPYQAKCLQWIREAFYRLDSEDRDTISSQLAGTGCEKLFGTSA